MTLYEHTFLARQDLSTQQVEALVQQYKTVIEENGGKLVKIENWGLKSLAYKIQKNRKAHYISMDLEAPSEAIFEVERQLRINEDILRFLTIRVPEHEEGPSAMLSRRDRDDQNEYDDRPRRSNRDHNSTKGDE